MKIVPAGFVSFIQTAQQMLVAELYTFTLLNGSQAFFTNIDMNITYGGNTFISNSLRIDGLKYKLAIGLQVDEQDVHISAYPDATLAGANFFQAGVQGLLDGATLLRQRGFWEIEDGRTFVDFQRTPVGVVTLFTGLISTIVKLGRTTMDLKVKSPLKLLDIDMPRNTYQPSCQWVLFDQGCTLDRGTFTGAWTVASATAFVITPTTPPSPVNGADGQPNFAQGRLIFTSGALNGFQTIISTNDATTFTMQYPFTTPPSPGDTFDASAGCLKTDSVCLNKFNNLLNFRGFPRVPPVHISV